MDDLISRQAAIDTNGLDEEIRCEMCKNPMHTDRGCDGNCKYDEKLYKKIIQILDKRITPLPPSQPEPKEGHWIPHETPDGGEQYECSRCGVLWEFNDGTPEDNEAYFCPKCGAKMTISTK